MLFTIELDKLPVSLYCEVLRWLIENDIGDVKKQEGSVNEKFEWYLWFESIFLISPETQTCFVMCE